MSDIANVSDEDRRRVLDAAAEWREMRARGLTYTRPMEIYGRAGVPVEPSGSPLGAWVPAWAREVAGAAAPYHHRLALLRRLARDPVAAQLVQNRPEAIAALLAPREAP